MKIANSCWCGVLWVAIDEIVLVPIFEGFELGVREKWVFVRNKIND